MTFFSCLLQYYTGHGQSINELKFHPRNCSLLLSVSKGVLRCNLGISVDCFFFWTVTSMMAVNSSLLHISAFSFCFKINLHNFSFVDCGKMDYQRRVSLSFLMTRFTYGTFWLLFLCTMYKYSYLLEVWPWLYFLSFITFFTPFSCTE